MAPSAVSLPPAPSTKAAQKEAERTSGDPALAFIQDEGTSPPVFEDKYEERKYLKHRLVIAFRIFASCGFADGVAGHITMRDPVDPASFWVNPFGMHFSLIRDEDLILVNHAGEVIDGGKNWRLNYAAYAIHAEIHKARPDVTFAAHSHSTYGRAFCATGRTLDPLTQDACVFYNDHVLYANFAGVVLAAEEGKSIARELGSKKAALLGNHGLLTVGPTIEAVVAWFVLLEKCCEVQLLADASSAGSGKPLVKIGESEAQNTWEALGKPATGYFMGLPLFQVAEKKQFGESTFLGRGIEPL
ncbi:class II aldolase/adducin domain protein [Mytilinidion resinicola]|uniref:Class II aldolase/adducin domain protein n=1 Tax=Mytilinidion resinicola TaxID=574789 RepID=A0A6A6Y6D5_9PEZI|nr:class II aldolase/adducin domain protein [Mytilinidion resinicola]KAF2804083.1 class II aldolase/adducin domain protein [Mytilinidion resinicola]